MISVQDSREGLIFYVHVRPGASRAGAGGDHDGALRVATTAPPECGAANEDVVRILARVLGIRRSQLSLLGGFKNRRKKIAVSDMSKEALERALNSL